MNVEALPLEGLYLVESARIGDERGSLMRLFSADSVPDFGARRIVQANQTTTKDAGTVRGMHFQMPPHAEMKFVRCLRGRVFDVAVDLRQGSPTFLRWHGEELSAENDRMLVIPEGFAHGFQALESDCELLYLHTAFYTPDAEGGLCHDDPALSIRWPLPVNGLSARDRGHPPITADFAGIAL